MSLCFGWTLGAAAPLGVCYDFIHQQISEIYSTSSKCTAVHTNFIKTGHNTKSKPRLNRAK